MIYLQGVNGLNGLLTCSTDGCGCLIELIAKVIRKHSKIKSGEVRQLGYISELRKKLGTRPIILNTVTVIVFNEQRQLLLQKRKDTCDWGTIGGALELGESLEEAARRELYEEAGLKARTMKFIDVLSGKNMYYKYPNGDEVYFVMAVYEADGIEGEPTINEDEGLELKYFSLDQPIKEMNFMAEIYLRKLGYIS